MQIVVLSGNLTRDCEVVPTKEGGEMLRFDVAVNDGREKEEKPTYYSCRMKKTGVADYLKKGRYVSLFGNLKVSVVQRADKTYVNLDVWVTSMDLPPLPKES